MKKKKKGSGKKRKKKSGSFKLLYFFIGAVLILCGAIYLVNRLEFHTVEKPVKSVKVKIKPEFKQSKKEEMPSAPHEIAAKLPKLAIIIDDIGYNSRYEEIITINVPLTLAILPFTPYSKEAALQGSLSGLEIILHIPMEPKGYPERDPGKGALLTAMSGDAITRQLKKDLDAVPNIIGVNNHMGSRFTEAAEGMRHVLVEVKERGLFFVDSKTTVNSTGLAMAREMGIKAAERSVFLDNIQTEEAIEKQLKKAVELAKTRGEAIAIGHPYRQTISVLKKMAPTLKNEGIQLVLASAIAR